mgnify:FL=1
MSVIRTFTVTVVSTGSGNKYFINGLQQETVKLAEGATYRFDQADNSNGNHPFRFSITSDGTHSGGSEYTTGVTTNGVPGNAGAYTEITVADPAPQLYYYCSVHSGMGGQADTVDSDTWGMLQWGQRSWGNQDDNAVSVTGTSLTTTMGVSDAAGEINSGWGRLEWGINGWGILGDVEVTGQQLATSQGIVSVLAELNSGWGRNQWGSMAWGVPYSTVVSGISLSSAIGTATSAAETIVTLTGQSLTSAIGNEAVGIGINVDVTGISLSANIGAVAGITIQGTAASMGIGPVDIQVDGSISINVTEHTIQSSIGSSTVEIAVGPILNTAGLLQTAVGSAIADANTLAAVTGTSLTGSLGNVDAVSVVDVTGISLTSSIGEEVPATDVTVLATTLTLITNIGNVDAVSVVDLGSLIASTFIGSVTTEQTANVSVVGISMSTSIGNVAVTPWSEVDLDVNNNWTEVDLAA